MRRIKRGKIRLLSLCPRGANRLPTIFKDDGGFELQMLTKEMDERGELLAVVYAPEIRDSQGDIASAAVIKDMLYESSREGMGLDLQHDGKVLSKEQAYVAEKFLIQKDDPRFSGMADYDGTPVDVTGAWGTVLKIDDPELRRLYREKVWGGVSMFGTAEMVAEKSDPEDPAERIARALEKKFNPTQQESTMTPEEIAKIATDAAVAAVVAMKKADADEAKKVAKAEADKLAAAGKANEAPVFKGDPTSTDDRKAHRDALAKHALAARLAKATTPAEIDAIEAELAKSEEPKSEDLKKAEAELAKAQEQIRKLHGKSNQPPPAAGSGGSDTSGSDGWSGLTKEQEDAAAIGMQMAKAMNEQRA